LHAVDGYAAVGIPQRPVSIFEEEVAFFKFEGISGLCQKNNKVSEHRE
jgi:hypothetical protein